MVTCHINVLMASNHRTGTKWLPNHKFDVKVFEMDMKLGIKYILGFRHDFWTISTTNITYTRP